MFFRRKTTPNYDAQGIWDATKREDYSSYLEKYGTTPSLKEQQQAKKKPVAQKKAKTATAVERKPETTRSPRKQVQAQAPATAEPKTKKAQRQAKRQAMYVALVNAPKTPKRWGLPLVILSAFVFLVLQLVISLVLLLRFAVPYLNLEKYLAAGDQQGLSDRLRDFINSPAEVTGLLDAFLKYLTGGAAVGLYIVTFAMYLSWLAFIAFATFVRGRKSFRLDFGLQFKRWDAPTGIALALVIFGVLGGIQAALQFAGFDLSGSDNSAPLRGSTGFMLFFTTFGVGGIIGPFFEELYFRGFVMQGFIRYFRRGLRVLPITRLGYIINKHLPGLYRGYLAVKRWLYHHKYVLAVLISSVFFGILHTQNVGPTTTFGQALVPVLTGAIGLVLGTVAVRSRRLGINIFTHMSYNTITLAAGFLFVGMVGVEQVLLFQVAAPVLLGALGLALIFKPWRRLRRFAKAE